jgi:hypothetical protein
MTRPDIRFYRDDPKRGETDAKWCAYVVEPNGHILRAGTGGHETPADAIKAMGGDPKDYLS